VSALAIIAYDATIAIMASVTVRNIDSQLKERLRVRAARHGRSTAEEVRVILREALPSDPAGPPNLAAAIMSRFQPLGGVELEIPPRELPREPPRFGR
jgi:antitoxin FitA